MLYEKRKKLILEILEEKNSVTTIELVEKLKVSEATIRRDLSNLEKEGNIYRVHGGAVLKDIELEEENIEEKSVLNIHEKRKIAKKAASLVKDKEFIYLDAGTTTYEMIPFLKDKDITVVTNGLTHIEELLKYKIESYLIGGRVKSTTRALVGSIALNNLKVVNFSRAFIGVNGIDIKFGYTTPDIEEAVLKSKAIENSIKAYILADYSKFGKVYFSKIAELEKATIITENIKEINENILKRTKIIGD
ncbi:DeoR/GlpR family DNA-binding transcription regulator [Miniphocaeibacter massiliensis]|uniref:DeoR/GlpR family DNA-binding transcription regulator n=1 Tax=Miniphocaeibacter massiliensis TaxID=2041841 RepID=UPI000C1C3EE2|nr:DeoR/GlpR family DNA-binding transcription regulator [Miniphocaeibacter massiliensis]